MKITVINGSMRHGSTWHCMDAIRQELEKYDQADVSEFFLPKDMPHFCMGCYACFNHGEDACPHAASIKPIVEAMIEAELVILTSPVYGFDVSGQMKAFLDHLCFMWMSHRPNPGMFHKIGLAISTTAGAGLRHTTKTMKNSLTYWGVKKVYTYQIPVAAMKWSDVSEEKKKKIKKDAEILAPRIAKSIQNRKKLPNPLFRSCIFKIMAAMQRKNDWNQTDRSHWEKHGWLSGGNPF